MTCSSAAAVLQVSPVLCRIPQSHHWRQTSCAPQRCPPLQLNGQQHSCPLQGPRHSALPHWSCSEDIKCTATGYHTFWLWNNPTKWSSVFLNMDDHALQKKSINAFWGTLSHMLSLQWSLSQRQRVESDPKASSTAWSLSGCLYTSLIFSVNYLLWSCSPWQGWSSPTLRGEPGVI